MSVNYGDLNVQFTGDASEVLRSVNEFLAKNIPSINLAQNLILNFTIKELIEKFHDYIRLTPEGPRVWLQNRKLSDKEIVALQLVGERIASESSGPSNRLVTLARMQESTSLSPKSLSSRLSELTKSGHVVRESKGQEKGFRISTQGIEWLSKVLEREYPN